MRDNKYLNSTAPIPPTNNKFIHCTFKNCRSSTWRQGGTGLEEIGFKTERTLISKERESPIVVAKNAMSSEYY